MSFNSFEVFQLLNQPGGLPLFRRSTIHGIPYMYSTWMHAKRYSRYGDEDNMD